MSRVRELSDWFWPTLAPYDPDYRSKLEHRMLDRAAHVRASCANDPKKSRRFLESVRKEFEDEKERDTRTRNALQGLFTLLGVAVAMLSGFSLWLASSHRIRAEGLSGAFIVAIALYATLQAIGAVRAGLVGWRVGTFTPLPHAAEALGDPMDAAEEIMRACLYNTIRTDDRVSYKKLAERFLLNFVVGLIVLALAIAGIIVHNVSQ